MEEKGGGGGFYPPSGVQTTPPPNPPVGDRPRRSEGAEAEPKLPLFS